MLNITGKSGTGKTRLLSEIINSAKSYNFQTLYCDAKKQNGFEILREFLCACLGLPYGTGNISCTLDDFSKYKGQQYDWIAVEHLTDKDKLSTHLMFIYV